MLSIALLKSSGRFLGSTNFLNVTSGVAFERTIFDVISFPSANLIPVALFLSKRTLSISALQTISTPLYFASFARACVMEPIPPLTYAQDPS